MDILNTKIISEINMSLHLCIQNHVRLQCYVFLKSEERIEEEKILRIKGKVRINFA